MSAAGRSSGVVGAGARSSRSLAACGGGSDSGSSATRSRPVRRSTTLKHRVGQHFFKPDKRRRRPPGIIEIKLKNIESGIHDLVIRDIPGFQLEVSGEGDTASRKVELTKGKYEFYCTIPGHEEAGMKGTLTVS